MLSFNNNLDVATHLPYLFHLTSLLLSTGPLSLRASVHGLVINIIHSLLTCKQVEFTGKIYNASIYYIYIYGVMEPLFRVGYR